MPFGGGVITEFVEVGRLMVMVRGGVVMGRRLVMVGRGQTLGS